MAESIDFLSVFKYLNFLCYIFCFRKLWVQNVLFISEGGGFIMIKEWCFAFRGRLDVLLHSVGVVKSKGLFSALMDSVLHSEPGCSVI